MNFATNIRSAIQKRRAYNDTVRAIQNMSLDTALDLDIYRGDAHKIASETIYG